MVAAVGKFLSLPEFSNIPVSLTLIVFLLKGNTAGCLREKISRSYLQLMASFILVHCLFSLPSSFLQIRF